MSVVPKTWAEVKVGDVFAISTGKLDANAAVDDGQFPFFTCAEYASRIDQFSFDCQAVLLAGNGGFSVKKYDGKFDAYQRTYVLEPTGLDLSFAYNLIRKMVPEITSSNRGSTIKYLRLGDITEVTAKIPPLPEQRRIVAKLDQLSARSTAARDHLAHTTKLATRAKQAILDAAFKSLTDSGCDTVAFSDIIEQSQNGISKRRGDSGEDTLVLRLADLTGGHFIGQDGRAIRLTEQEREKYLLEEGDLVCIRVNGSEKLVGRMLRWKSPQDWCFCDHFIRFRLRPDGASSDYVSWFFATDEVRRGIEGSFVSSAGQKTVSQKTLGKFVLPLPSVTQQSEIVRRIDAAFARIDRLTEEATRAAHLVDRLDERLLAKAFAGELVPQDPNDEPAEALLARIREARAAAPKPTRGRKKKATV